MIATPADLQAILADTAFRDAECARIAMPGRMQHALAMRVGPGNAFGAWRILRDRIDATGRWPVITTAWMSGGSWSGSMAEADFFNRFEYLHSSPGDARLDRSAQAILARSLEMDLDAFVRPESDYWHQRIDEFIACNLEAMRQAYGVAPSHAEAARAAALVRLSKDRAVERWLLEWEIARFGLPRLLDATDLVYQEWFDPAGQPMALLLMPFARGPELLAHMHFYGACAISSEIAIAYLRHWEERHGAELVAHFGTMLQLVVARPPTDIDAAFELACEHEQFAPCTTSLPGVALRDHAKALLRLDRWFLHERP